MTKIFIETSKLKVIYVGSTWPSVNADIPYMFYNSGVLDVTTCQC